MAGYSKNPLWKKLGIKEGYVCYLFSSPDNYFELLEETPKDTEWDDQLSSALYDFQHVFTTHMGTLKSNWGGVEKST